MAGISKINRLPKEAQRLITAWFDQGFTVDEVTEHLKTMGAPVSRSSVGRKRQEWAKISARVRESREMAEAIAREYRDEPSSVVAAANLEMMHSLLNRVLRSESEGEEVTLKPGELMQLTRALSYLAGGRKAEVETTIRAEKAAAETEASDAAQGEGGVIEIRTISPEGAKMPQVENSGAG
ncbi:MAG: DUF3486 family protein [Deltaproteobacteria bacterium]|jgi:hypothetical protein|nr:DUF3486 family protein [Deltaproteobacteria bacterium]